MKLLILLITFSSPLLSLAQCFSGGSGVDGAYHATVNTTLAGGTYNFTTFTIDAGVTVAVTGNIPLEVNCQGAAIINGTLTASGGNGTNGVTYTSGGIGGIGVAGGMNGGNGSFASGSGPIDGTDGGNLGGASTKGMAWSGGGGAGYAQLGSSSGNPSGGFGGSTYGDSDITGLTAGSGGGGGSGGYDCGAGGGGAGGGVIYLVAQSITINSGGAILSKGGNGGSDGIGNCGGGGGGSGGSIYLVTPTLQNDGSVNADGGIGGASNVAGSPYFGTGGVGSVGRIRVDGNAVSGSGTFFPSIGAQYTVNAGPITNQSVSICDGDSFTVGTSTYNTAGTFQDILVAVSGCDSTVNTTITLLATSSFNQSLAVCFGESVTIGTNTYNTSGTYQDIFTAANGCDSIVTTTLLVEDQIDASIMIDGSTLTASSSTGTYQWIDCGNGNAPISGATSSTFTPTQNGSYALIVTDNACSDTSACEMINDIGLQELVLASSVSPNPTTGKISIELASSETATITLTDFAGRIIQTIPTYVSGTKIDLGPEARGVYFLNVYVGTQVQTLKVSKQ